MTTTLIVLGLVFWFGCGLVAQAAFKTNAVYNFVKITWKHRLFALILLSFGLISLLSALSIFFEQKKNNGKQPWKWTNLYYFFPKNLS